MAPGPEGGLYVLIPMRTAPAVLALLDSTGRPRAGWPVAVLGATFCDHLLPVKDGSIRIVCTMENPDGNMFDPIGAFAFEPNGRLLAGWPVSIEGFFITAQVVGDDLTIFVSQSLGDVEIEGQPSFSGGLVTIAQDGHVEYGVRATDVGHCFTWKIGPDGVAYDCRLADRFWAYQASGPDVSLPNTPSGDRSMRASLHRVMTTIVVGLIVVARASGPGSTLILASPRPGHAPRDQQHHDRPSHP